MQIPVWSVSIGILVKLFCKSRRKKAGEPKSLTAWQKTWKMRFRICPAFLQEILSIWENSQSAGRILKLCNGSWHKFHGVPIVCCLTNWIHRKNESGMHIKPSKTVGAVRFWICRFRANWLNVQEKVSITSLLLYHLRIPIWQIRFSKIRICLISLVLICQGERLRLNVSWQSISRTFFWSWDRDLRL